MIFPSYTSITPKSIIQNYAVQINHCIEGKKIVIALWNILMELFSGILFKDPLVKQMEEYVDSSTYSDAKFTNNYNLPANDFGEPHYARPYPSEFLLNICR